MDKLKELLGEELYNQFLAKLGETKVIIDDGKFIPKHRLDEVIAEKKTIETQNAKYATDFDELKKKVVGNEQLTATITQLQAEKETAKKEAEALTLKTRKEFSIKEGLLNQGVNDEQARELLASRFDLAKVELDDNGKVKGFDTMTKPFKENKAFSSMFGTPRIEGSNHNPAPNPDSDLFTREQILALTPEQLADSKTLEKVNKSMEKLT